MSVSPDRNSTPVIQSDTFWELIEKLLLKKTRDEQSRQRHDAALSALCRGHALSRLPRDQKPKTPNKIILKSKELSMKSKPNATHNPDVVKQSSGEFKASAKVGKRGRKPDDPEEENQRSKSEIAGQHLENAKQAKSECQLNDLDIVYLKDDTAVPASERLWRYAIKNRKKEEDELWEKTNEVKRVPSILSNEAIYLGLQKRVKKRDFERKLLREEREKRSCISRQHSCSHLEKIRSEMQINKARNARGKRTASSHFQKPPQTHVSRRVIQPSGPIPLMPQGIPEKDTTSIPPCPSPTEMLTPWENDDAWSNLTKLATVKCKERVESKRQMYTNVIRRRLKCGSQIETFNKEIINKKNSGPGHVLSKETQRRYSELKNEYLNLCYEESTLRNQIALLHAEIYMMQNKGYHKTPATVKTITLDSQSTPLHRSHAYTRGHVSDFNTPKPMLFPSLKAPRPLISSQHKVQFDKIIDKPEKRRPVVRSERKIELHDAGEIYLPNIGGRCSPVQGVCSIYSISPQIATKPREPFTLPERKIDKLIHRLPRMDVNVETGSDHNIQC